ncbi:MAG: endonuclease/exonuclease/phosphatase family protein [Anaerolineales bacterium]
MGKKLFTIAIVAAISLVSLFLISNIMAFSNPIQYTICEIQGSGFISPIVGEYIITSGVVFADADDSWRKGFFMQNPDCDGDTSTSDGLFVYIGEEENVVSPGDLVSVYGKVQEYKNLTEIRTSPISVTVQSSGNPIPAAVSLNPPFDNDDAAVYIEALEGMHVKMSDAKVVGPTDYDNRTWVIRSDHDMEHVFYDDQRGTGEVVWVDDLGPYHIHPDVKVGERILNLSGAMDYFFDVYSMFLLTEPQVVTNSLITKSEQVNFGSDFDDHFSVATFNLWNMFDAFDDPETEDTKLSEAEYQRRLHKKALAIHIEMDEPNVIAVQEVENYDVLADLVNQPEIVSNYEAVLVEGPDRRGLDTGFLYQTDQVEILAFEQKQGCTDLVDGLGPDGNHDLQNPENNLTCDTDGDGINDGNRLFSRPPLIVHAQICLENCDETAAINPYFENKTVEIWFVVNHWKSKFEDTDSIKYSLPRRLKQSQFVANLVQGIFTSDQAANVIVLGDLNDTINSQPLQTLEDGKLHNLMRDVLREERYSYIYQGISQTLDHILVSTIPEILPVAVNPKHINSDYPYSFYGDNDSPIRSSDHDPIYSRFGYFEYSVHFPLIVSDN